MKKLFIAFSILFALSSHVFAQESCPTTIIDNSDYEQIQNTQTQIDRVLCAPQSLSSQTEEQIQYGQLIKAQAAQTQALVQNLNPDLDQAATIFDSQAHMIYENPETLMGPKDMNELREYGTNNKVVLEMLSKPLPQEMLYPENVLTLEQFNQIRQEMFRVANPSRFSGVVKMGEEEKKRLPLEDACYLRATMVSEFLARHFPHVPVMKSWLLTDKAFQFGDKTWIYHVSPFVPVKVGQSIKWMALDTITLGQPAMDIEEWVDFVIFKDKDDKRRQAPIKVEVTYGERLIPSTCILNLNNIQERNEDWQALQAASFVAGNGALRATPVNEQVGPEKKKGFFQKINIFKKKK